MALTDTTRNYLTTLARTYGLDDKALIAKAEADEAAAKFVDESVMLRSDYSRKQDEVTNMRKEIEAKQTELNNYYEKQWLPQWKNREAEFATKEKELTNLKAKEAAYRATYGDLDGFQPAAAPAAAAATVASPAAAQPQYISREDAANLAGTLAKEMTRVGLQYYKETGDVLDVDAFEQHVMKGGYQGKDLMRRAYDDFVKPQREARATADFEAKLKAAREEGARDYATKHAMPMDNGAPAVRGSAIFHPPQDDPAAAVLNDANAPAFAKDQALRDSFMKDLGPITPGGILRSS